MEHIIYLNGYLLPRSRARISPFDHGFLYGYALFETMRARSGNIFRLERHLARLAGSAELINLPLEGLDLGQACYDTLRANGLDDARIRLTVSIGEGECIPEPPASPEPTVFIVATAYTPPPADTYRDGFTAVVSSIRQNSFTPLARLKSANYLNNVLARQEAKEMGADEALLLNERDRLCEGSTSNIFLVSRGILVTPDEESGCLPGITRQAVIELAAEAGIGVEQREVLPEEVLQADQAFLTSSLLGLMPLREVDGSPIGEREERAITTKLMAAYNDLVQRETA